MLNSAFRSLCLLIILGGGAALLAGCGGPRMLHLSEARYEALAPDDRVDVYVGELAGEIEKLAVIETDAYAYVDDTVKEHQIDQLKAKARGLGANAIQDVRILPKRVKSFTADEKVPFAALKQGTYELYFMRATAVRVPDSEPASAADLRPGRGWVVEHLPAAQPLSSAQQLPMPGLAPAPKAETLETPPAP